MKMSKKLKGVCITAALGAALCASSVQAATRTQTLKATYRDIRVTYNGEYKSLAIEPFIVNGSTYVPLAAVGQILGAEAKWDSSSSTVNITGGSSSSSDTAALQQQLAISQAQVSSLQSQLTAAQNELAQYKNNSSSSSSSTTSGTDISDSALKETVKKLQDDYSDDLSDDIDMEFTLSKRGSGLKLTLSYSSRSENTAFDKLKEKTISNYLDDVCSAIAARHKDVAITGAIEYKGDEKVSFTYSKNGKLNYNMAFDENDVVDSMANYGQLKVGGYRLSFSNPTASLNSDTVNCTITINPNKDNDKNFIDAWNANSSSVYTGLDDLAYTIWNDTNANDDDYTLNITVKHSNGTILAKYSSTRSNISDYSTISVQ